MTPDQCRAGRGWLDWSQSDLANASGVSLPTVQDYEKGRVVPVINDLAAIQFALDKAGIGFAFDVDGRACAITFSKANSIVSV